MFVADDYLGGVVTKLSVIKLTETHDDDLVPYSRKFGCSPIHANHARSGFAFEDVCFKAIGTVGIGHEYFFVDS